MLGAWRWEMEGLKCWHRTSEGYLDIGTSVRRVHVRV
jgi:hypothetical protein